MKIKWGKQKTQRAPKMLSEMLTAGPMCDAVNISISQKTSMCVCVCVGHNYVNWPALKYVCVCMGSKRIG